MNGVPLTDFLGTLLAAGLVAAVPLTLAGLGEAFGQRAGLLNLGIEGVMLCGAFFGFWAAQARESVGAGLAAGLGVGLVLGLGFGLLAVALRVDQVPVGLGITLAGVGLTGFLHRDVFGGQSPALAARPDVWEVPLLGGLPVVGEGVFRHGVPVYAAWALVPLAAFALRRTRFGLDVRAVGEHPFAADAAGVDVGCVRLGAAALGGAGAGLAGAFLSVVEVGVFTEGMTVGQGFIALALAMLGRWDPVRIALGAALFGTLGSLGTGLQLLDVEVRSEFVTMLPYLGILVALVVLAGRTALPAALGVPYERGDR